MVTIIDYAQRQKENGESFFVLILQGGIEMVTSKAGGVYMTARKTSISSTFDEPTCRSLIGQQLPGEIERFNVEPYEYTVEQTGEVIMLSHRYRYVQEKKVEKKEFPMYKSSENGHLVTN